MKLYGLIGFPLKNTFSKDYFTQLFNQYALNEHAYENFPIAAIETLHLLITQQPNLCGFNVTVPHKQNILPFLHTVDAAAEEIAAINCVKVIKTNSDIQLHGYNTDVYGFKKSLLPLLKPWHQKALVLGTGGASKAVCYVLKKLGIEYTMVSRNETKGITYEEIDKHIIRTHQLIINCTPTGMFPNENEYPHLPYEFITDMHLAYDLIYLPEETLFLRQCKAQGAVTKNGLEMLHLQADKSWEIWNS